MPAGRHHRKRTIDFLTVDSRRSQVTSAHGSAWADFDVAADKSYSETNLGVAEMHHVTALPCREITLQPISPAQPLFQVAPIQRQ